VTTLTIHVTVNLILYVVATSLGAPIDIVPTLAIVLVVSALANVVPTPGGSGYMELALGLVLTRQAAPGEVAPAVLTWRAFSYYASVAAGSAAAASLASSARHEPPVRPARASGGDVRGGRPRP
jgi:uncharacterized protein (TIRG00374 family)